VAHTRFVYVSQVNNKINLSDKLWKCNVLTKSHAHFVNCGSKNWTPVTFSNNFRDQRDLIVACSLWQNRIPAEAISVAMINKENRWLCFNWKVYKFIALWLRTDWKKWWQKVQKTTLDDFWNNWKKTFYDYEMWDCKAENRKGWYWLKTNIIEEFPKYIKQHNSLLEKLVITIHQLPISSKCVIRYDMIN